MKMKTTEYHGIRPTDPGGRNGLRNPERGWRIETLIAEQAGSRTWGPAHHLRNSLAPAYSDDWWILDAERYEPFGLTLAQTYCYLDKFIEKPISDEKLELLQTSLDNVRKRGLKTVLRFAYERDMDRREGPELHNVIQHIEQLAPLIRRNDDIIFVLQAGFVGAWGEWHSSAHQLEQDHSALAAIVSGVLNATSRMTQVRVPKYKRWVLEQPALGKNQILDDKMSGKNFPVARIGFHNDGFLANNTCGGTWTEPPLFSNPGNPEFDYMTVESPYVPVDGELFWSDIGGKVDGLKAAVRMRLHHYSSFSIAHSYVEREGKPFSIDDWMITPLTAEHLIDAKLPVSDGYFGENDCKRTIFEYITDHLGYRLEIQRATFPESMQANDNLSIDIELINRGFSIIHNPRPVCFVLIGCDRSVTELGVAKTNPRGWQPFQPGDDSYKPLSHSFGIKSALPAGLDPGWYNLGLWMPDEILRYDPMYAIKVANRDIPWWTDDKYGVNILGSLNIVKG